ncbi:hypothetical protein IGI37_000831 [Enterococcus sp. AZ194]|uniref:hypothetical protein n=1 Tax=Enterococcus sp. AZ194 TaxID=2774629 RepID=UPI003F215FF3
MIPKSNLQSLSTDNKQLVLSQNSEATVVFGSAQWRTLGRQVDVNEMDHPIMILKPVFEPGSNDVSDFISVPVYDISQTVVLTEAERRSIDTNLRQVPTGPRSSKERANLSWWLVMKNRKGLQDYLNKAAYRDLQNEIEQDISV